MVGISRPGPLWESAHSGGEVRYSAAGSVTSASSSEPASPRAWIWASTCWSGLLERELGPQIAHAVEQLFAHEPSASSGAPRRRTPAPPGRKGSASTLCGRSLTTGQAAPASRWPSCCGRGTPAPTWRQTTSRLPAPRWRSCPGGSRGAGRCWSGPTAAAPTPSSPGCTSAGCPTRSGSPSARPRAVAPTGRRDVPRARASWCIRVRRG